MITNSEHQKYLIDESYYDVCFEEEIKPIKDALLKSMLRNEQLLEYLIFFTKFSPHELIFRGHHISNYLKLILKQKNFYLRLLEESIKKDKYAIENIPTKKILTGIAEMTSASVTESIKNEKSKNYILDYYGNEKDIKKFLIFLSWIYYIFIYAKPKTQIILTTDKDLFCKNCAIGNHCTQLSQRHITDYQAEDMKNIMSVINYLNQKNRKYIENKSVFIVRADDFRLAVLYGDFY